MIVGRRDFCHALGASIFAVPAACALGQTPVFRPEDFGARGDGVTNDTAAFTALAAQVNAAGGGTIALSRRTYVIGRQRALRHPTAEFAFAPASLLEFRDCRYPLIVRGNGARLVCAPDLRFGSFDPATGVPTHNALPFYGLRERSTPYLAMIYVARSAAPILIENLELDGNVGAQKIGGPWGDLGRQISATGIMLVDNRSSEIIRDVHSHHHPTDGLILDGLPAAPRNGVDRVVERLRATDNGRQGVSVVGGHGYVFRDCTLGRSGRGPVQSPPGAGLDIEAEGGKTIRGLTFERCTFFDNLGCGMVCDTGDSADLAFRDCRFVGTTSWSAWPRKPSVAFSRCAFVGAISNTFGDANPRRATRFADCEFLDDPALAGGRVYLGGGRTGPIANLYIHQNILFERCRFRLTHAGLLPWSTDAIYSDCTMSQSNPTPSYPRGTFRGRNLISGAAILASSRNEGELVLNGRSLGPGRL